MDLPLLHYIGYIFLLFHTMVFGVFLYCISKSCWPVEFVNVNKAAEEQITAGLHVGSPRLTVCALLYACACCLQINPEAQKDDPALSKDRLKTAEEPFWSVNCIVIPTSCIAALLYFSIEQLWVHYVRPFLLLLSFEIFLLLFAEESNREDCDCTIFLHLSSLTSSL